MLSSITSWVEDKATGYLRTGIQAGGSLAGNAVGGVGGLVENAGKSAAQGMSRWHCDSGCITNKMSTQEFKVVLEV